MGAGFERPTTMPKQHDRHHRRHAAPQPTHWILHFSGLLMACISIIAALTSMPTLSREIFSTFLTLFQIIFWSLARYWATTRVWTFYCFYFYLAPNKKAFPPIWMLITKHFYPMWNKLIVISLNDLYNWKCYFNWSLINCLIFNTVC